MAKKLNTNVTVHNLDTGESGTFGPDDELPSWAADLITNEDVYDDTEAEDAPVPGPSQAEGDLIGQTGGGSDDPLMKRSKDDLVAGAEEWGAEGVTDSNNKAELAAAIRAAGYEGDGSDLLEGE